MKHEQPPDEALERIVEAHWSYSSGGPELHRVKFHDRIAHDVINYTLHGELEVDGEMYGFLIEDGNWNGTVVKQWGDPEDVSFKEDPPDPFTLIPERARLPKWCLEVYFFWREQPWFKELARNWAYDRHFAPGGKTEGYWRPKAEARGLRAGRESEVPALKALLEAGGHPEPISEAELRQLWIRDAKAD